nr:filamentous hemagglutinin N-terminal domain-containing protein [Burkholderia gladioli]
MDQRQPELRAERCGAHHRQPGQQPEPSQIRGALEIAGARAELVLANPSGIYLDGAGFINTSRATLTAVSISMSPVIPT